MHTPHCWSTQTHYTSNHHTHTIALTHPVTHPIIYPTRVLKSPTYLSLHWGTVAKTCRYIYHIRCQTSTHKQMHRLLAREPHNNKPPSPSRYYIPPIYTLCNIVQGRYRYMRDLQSLNTARPQKQPILPHSAALITIPLNLETWSQAPMHHPDPTFSQYILSGHMGWLPCTITLDTDQPTRSNSKATVIEWVALDTRSFIAEKLQCKRRHIDTGMLYLLRIPGRCHQLVHTCGHGALLAKLARIEWCQSTPTIDHCWASSGTTLSFSTLLSLLGFALPQRYSRQSPIYFCGQCTAMAYSTHCTTRTTSCSSAPLVTPAALTNSTPPWQPAGR